MSKPESSLDYLKRELFDVIQWGKKGTGKYYSSEELCEELEKRGLGPYPENIIGMYLTKNKYRKRIRFFSRADPDDPDDDSINGRQNTWCVSFKEDVLRKAQQTF